MYPIRLKTPAVFSGLLPALFAILLGSLKPSLTHAQANRPTVWMSPPGYDHGRCFRELFEHPEQWQETRSLIDVLFSTDLKLNKEYKDEELKAWLPKLKEWNLKLALEVGVVKEWSLSGEKTFKIEQPMWDRIQRLMGGNIYAIAMDEPLLAVREHVHQPDELALTETAKYIALVRQHYPEMLVGDIETYPSLSLAEHLQWIDSLNKKLAEQNVRGLDFYRLDVDWLRFTVQNRGSWKELKELEKECRKRKLLFSLIYWASGYPAMHNKGLADDSTWYTYVMQQGYDYKSVGGAPDQYVIESWLEAPSRSLPENGEFTFTRSVRDFTKKFVKPPAVVPAK